MDGEFHEEANYVENYSNYYYNIQSKSWLNKPEGEE